MPSGVDGGVDIVPEHKDYLSLIFRRCVLALVGARVPENTAFERRMIEQLVELAEEYFTDLTSHLQRISSMQRRSTPSMADVGLLLHFNQLNVFDLISEINKTPQIEESKSVVALNELYFDPEEAPLDDKQIAFFERPKRLVAPTVARPPYMPEWMPTLPPEHTYKHTPSHSSQIRDLRTVRLSLVEEGWQAERALQRLLGEKGSSSVIELPKHGKDMAKKSMVIVDDQRAADDSMVDVTRGDDRMQDESASYIKEEHTHDDTRSPTPSTSGALIPASLSTPQPEPDRSGKSESLRIQLHLGSRPETQPKKLSLKLSLGKKKRQESMLQGKRPKVDIVSLARQHARNSG